MEKYTPKTVSMLMLFCGVATLAPCIFFLYYTIRLIYINLTMEDAAAHRNGGMLIGAIVFPTATIICGLLSWFFINKARRGFTEK